MSNIERAFDHGKAFIAFITCGDPDLETTATCVKAAVRGGADLIELGIPFSDPTYNSYQDITELPPHVFDEMAHFFSVYKNLEGKDTVVLPIGKKAVDFFKARQAAVLTEDATEAGAVTVGDCFSLAKHLCKAYCRGEVDEVFIYYTRFVSVLSQVPERMQLLPLIPEVSEGKSEQMLYEPNSEAVLEAIIPEYLGGVLYGALCESRASEQAARRTAMNAATQNAEEMIADLSLKFNQALQAAITQEITEIVAGS